MKKYCYIAAAAALILCLCACSKSGGEESAQSSVPESRVSAYSKSESQSSKQSRSSQVQQSSQTEPSLPNGVTKASSTKLRYSTSVMSFSAVFPDEFYIEADDYKPQNGIYLQNDKGTATLLLETVKDNTMTYREMKEYLSELYPQAEVRVTDKKDVICRRKMTDKSGKEYFAMEKFHPVRGGYHLAALCCRPEDKAMYYGALLDVDFS